MVLAADIEACFEDSRQSSETGHRLVGAYPDSLVASTLLHVSARGVAFFLLPSSAGFMSLFPLASVIDFAATPHLHLHLSLSLSLTPSVSPSP
jgi:hypothetical protein